MRRSYQCLVMSAAVVAAAAVSVAAQQDTVRTRQNPAQASNRAQRPAAEGAEVRAVTPADHFFANCVKSESENEIALAKFAQQHAQNEDVKKFIHQMIQDHTQCVEKLQAVASTDAARQTTAAAAQGADRPIQRAETKDGVIADNTTRSAAAQKIAGVDMMQLKKELSQQCLASIKAELEKKSGPEFDRCFMGQQVLAHLAMWDALKVFQKHASPEFQPTLASAQQKTEQHLQEARRIAKDLDANAPRTASRAVKAAE
jgi:predicted outer membrane protein